MLHTCIDRVPLESWRKKKTRTEKNEGKRNHMYKFPHMLILSFSASKPLKIYWIPPFFCGLVITGWASRQSFDLGDPNPSLWPNGLTHGAGRSEGHATHWILVIHWSVYTPFGWGQTSWAPSASLFHRRRWAQPHASHADHGCFGITVSFKVITDH